MKKNQVTLNKNLSAPRTPHLEIPTKPQRPLKQSHSNSKNASIKYTSKPKSVGIKSKRDVKQHTSTSKDAKSPAFPKGKRGFGSKKEEPSEAKGKRKNIYTGQQSEKNYLEKISQHSFEDIAGLKFILLGYIFKNRLIKDEQYNQLYEELVERFPQKEETIKKVLFQIVSSLDS